jgi:ABC-type glycerol-3-phosphate transport system permease component
MNRAFFIILIPPLLVLIGYVVVFRAMGGVAPAYWRVILPVVLLGGALWWVSSKSEKKT